MERDTEITSPLLADALQRFGLFLRSDDLERTAQIEGSDVNALTALADAVDPLFDEINGILDKLAATAHPPLRK